MKLETQKYKRTKRINDKLEEMHKDLERIKGYTNKKEVSENFSDILITY